jgi:hypothetical protein
VTILPLFDPIAFGNEVYAEKHRRYLSLLAVEREAHVDLNTIYRTIHGEAPNVENYLRLQQWLSASKRKK